MHCPTCGTDTGAATACPTCQTSLPTVVGPAGTSRTNGAHTGTVTAGTAATVGDTVTVAVTVTPDATTVDPLVSHQGLPTLSTVDPDTTGMPGSPRKPTPAHILPTGHAFGPRYHIIDLLGVGGMGEVYRAWDSELSIAVALKVIRGAATTDPRKAAEQERRFKSELLLARKVTHKNVVRIHDIGEIDGIKYISMPYIQGQNLSSILKTAGALGVPRALKLARQTASGLQAAHEAEVVHRDLKPANVMVDLEDHAVIMDFGIAHSTSDAQNAGVAGTLAYMAPEQATGQPVDQRADIYAFGLILYEMLGGPRKPTSDPAKIFAPLKPIREITPQVPEALATVVERCTAFDVAGRYATSAELVEALSRLDEFGELIPEPRRLTPRLIAAAATVVLVLVTSFYFLGQFNVEIPVEQEEIPVVLADFVNSTGNAAFDGIEEILQVALEEAPYISVFDGAKNLAAQLFPDQNVLTRENAQLIANREGLKVVLAGSVASSGRGFRINVDAINPSTGDTIAAATRSVSGTDQVLASLTSIAAELREAFGESEEVTEAAAAGETFTTTSLDAMRAYAAGQAFMDRGQYSEAINEFQRAITFDAQLGRAYAGMAVAYRNDSQNENARQAYEAAFKLIDRMTDRERYRTLGGYYFTVHGNYEKAVENYEALIKQFPADKVGLANLAFAHLMLGNVQRALVVGKEAMDADQRSPFKRFNYAMYALYNGEFEASREQTPILLKDNPKLFLAWLPAALTSLSLGDVAQARQAYASMAAMEDPEDPDVREGARSLAAIGTGDLGMYLGRPAGAIADLRAAAERDVAEEQPDKAAHKYVALADAHLAMNSRGQATEAARRALSLSSLTAVVYPAARILVQTGEIDDARKIAMELSNRLQTQTVAYADLIRGEIALRQGDVFAAVEAFRAAQGRFDSWFSRYLLGTAYATAERFTEALTEFEACIKRRGEVTDVFFENTPTIRYLPAAYYWLARSQEASGLTAAARENYQTFLNLRTNTDTPDRLASEAAERLAKIQ